VAEAAVAGTDAEAEDEAAAEEAGDDEGGDGDTMEPLLDTSLTS
jgi:hypothetical protein